MSMWSRGARLLQPASRSASFATMRPKPVAPRAKPAAASARASERERPSYLTVEIERMKKAYEEYSERPPKPFKLKRSGDVDLVLTRRKGHEDIQVHCALAFHPRGGPPDGLYPEELDGGDEVVEQKVVVNITITITKPAAPESLLELNVDCDRRGYLVNHILFRGYKNHDEDYFPAFWRMGPELRSEFFNFLESRGLDEMFACWVHDQMDDKAFKARLRHLEKINAFVESKSSSIISGIIM